MVGTGLVVALLVGCAEERSPVHPSTPGGTTAVQSTPRPPDVPPSEEVVESGSWDCEGTWLPSLARTCALAPDTAALDLCATTGAAALRAGQGFATLAEALAGTAPDDVVTVCPGTWDGNVQVDGPLVLQAADPTPGATVLEPAGIVTGLEVELRGLTLRGGVTQVSANGALTLECMVLEQAEDLAVSTGDAVTVRTSVFRDNAGGAIGAWWGELVVEDSVFERNGAGREATVSARGETTVTRSAFLGNGGEGGGALDWHDEFGGLSVSGTLFQCNTTVGEGGALSIQTGDTSSLAIRGSTFVGNSAGRDGGAIDLYATGPLEFLLADTVVEGNRAEGPAFDVLNFLNPVTLTFARTRFTDNRTTSGASAIGVTALDGSVELEAVDLVVLRNEGGASAVVLRGDGVDGFDCTRCAFGQGADDNVPLDLLLGEERHADLGASFAF